MVNQIDALVEVATLAISRIDEITLFSEIEPILRSVSFFDISVAFSYPRSGKPEVLYDGLKGISLPNAMSDYLAGGYLLDAVYVACRQGLADGLYRLSTLAPDAFFESDYFLSPLVHPCISMESGSLVEEIAFCTHAPDGTALVYSLMRSKGTKVFSDKEFSALKPFSPIINAAMIRYWQNRIDKKVQECSTPDFNSEALNLSFRNFERERLSPREQDVVALLLRGHSSLSAAKNLGIAEGTVKIHRKNIYAKLGISSQSMLFSRFITSIIKH
ncbi:helix-turn-helix transcriptional regulator [Acetobacter estunensis]|uniref:helix-turn-helix transcriptional regulator n=1 Tax=Acetobacter estunensis TaxID=104097 RepID=UPI001C2D78FE|nr:helix-turn-helix transcriptional regulator [Acetobacter estunensis]